MKNQALVDRYTSGLVLALADDADYARVEAELRGLAGALVKPRARFEGLDYGLEVASRLGRVGGLVRRLLERVRPARRP